MSRYRYWGSVDPRGRHKPPLVRAEAPPADGAAELFVYDVIDSWGGEWGISAREVAEALGQLGEVEQITVRLNSPGGEVHEAVAIANMLAGHPARITVQVDALAASAASYLLVRGDEAVVRPDSEVMIHDAWGIAMGPAADMHKAGDDLDRVSGTLAAAYARKAGGDAADWRTAMLAETWYTADEAVAAGLADRLDDGGAQASVRPVVFDLSEFKHPGRGAAPSPALAPAALAGARLQEINSGLRAALKGALA